MSISGVGSALNAVYQNPNSTNVANNLQKVVAMRQRDSADSGNPNPNMNPDSVLQSMIVSSSLKLNAWSKSLSSITDIDVAIETANLTMRQIKQQAAVSILAQSNVLPPVAISLL